MSKKDATTAPKRNIIKEDFKKLFSKGHFYPFRKRWWKELYYIFWNAKNRYLYGYSDEDWFNWDWRFAERNLELFKQFKAYNHSLMHKYPASICERNSELWVESFTEEEQDNFFDMLIACLEDMKDTGDTVAERLYGKKYWDCDKEEWEEIRRERQASIDCFFDTVRDRFDDFWD